jgi:predicted O-methyltransferase YrrM
VEYPNWFKQTAQENFRNHLTEFKDLPNLNFLQIGAFTGDASLWMLQNILTNPSSSLYDVDTWKGSDEQVHAEMDFEDVYNVYLAKTGYRNRYFNRTTSVDFLLFWGKPHFDFIYIDGDHTASAVLDDAVLAWQFLKPGGIMAFDDYTWEHPTGNKYLCPKAAINLFVTIKRPELDLVAVNDQFWIRKK